VLTQIPFALTIWYSLHRWNLPDPDQKGFAGLYNFRATFGDNTYWKAIKNTVVHTGGATIAGVGAITPLHRSSSCPWRSLCSGAAPCPTVAAGIIPIYVVAQHLHLLNTVVVLLILHLGMNSRLPYG
jgi:ABC-type sugar transport system permease subunit